MLRSRKMSRLLLLAVICTSFSFVSCEYVARFIIRIDEGATLPCIGVHSLTFIVDDLEESQRAYSSEATVVPTEQKPENAFWRMSPSNGQGVGTCRIPQGILIKNIPYGGKRKLIIQARDSSGLLVASGASPTFTFEPRGDDVKDLIAMDLVRGCESFDATRCTKSKNVSLGTLVITLPNNASVATSTTGLRFQSDPVQAQNLPKIDRTVQVIDGNFPASIILTNIPVSGQRSYTVHALDKDKRELTRWQGTYSTPTTLTPSNASIKLKASVVGNPSP